ncbi:MAG: ABC transporter permease, partial [Armatimonadetes bacterium]|nr:ABC transporter permease [Armatimonadota bacterium]
MRAVAQAVGRETGRPARLQGFPLLARQVWRRRSAAVGVLVLLAVAISAVGAPWLAPASPYAQRLLNRLTPPGGQHLLGTDQFGRDLLSRLMWGGRVSLLVAVAAVGGAAVIGTGMGLAAGYFGGVYDQVVMRVVDVLMAFPVILLAIAILAVLGSGVGNLIIAITVSGLPHFARLIRAETLRLRELDFVEAARALGASHATVMVRHILRNTLSPVVILATLRVSTAILTESTLSFLGLGISPPTPTWGGMVSDGLRFLQLAPWASIIPGLAITVAVLA